MTADVTGTVFPIAFLCDLVNGMPWPKYRSLLFKVKSWVPLAVDEEGRLKNRYGSIKDVDKQRSLGMYCISGTRASQHL